MADNFIQRGNVLDYSNSSGNTITSGSGVVVATGIFGVAGADISDGAVGAVHLEGVFELDKATNEGDFAVGDKLFWNASTKKLTKVNTGNTPVGICFAVAAEAAAKAQVKLGGASDFSPSDMGEITVAAVVAALTDNGGGTADGTIDSQAAPVTLTDSTGGEPTHDDTLAAVTESTAVTDNSTGATTDTILAEITNAANAGSADITPTKDAIAKLAVLANANSAAVGVLKQNQSDVAQKVIELVTLAGTAQNNLKELSTKVNAILTALKAANLMASA